MFIVDAKMNKINSKMSSVLKNITKKNKRNCLCNLHANDVFGVEIN